VQIGAEVPDFEVELTDGAVFKLSEQRGKVVLVNIWATWCPPCVGEMPDLQKLSEDYEDRLVVLGLNSGEDAETISAFFEKNGYTYPAALDEDYKLSTELFPTAYIPYTVIIDPNGVVTEMQVGAKSYEVFQGYIDAALAGAETPAA